MPVASIRLSTQSNGGSQLHNGGTALGHGVTVGKVNGGGIGINTPVGSATLSTRHGHGAVELNGSIGNGVALSSTVARSSSGSSLASSHHTAMNGSSHVSSTRTTVIESGVSNISSSGVVATATVAVSGAQMFAEATKKEKEEMQRLNDRLSNYIARVKQLEEQNKQIVAALGQLRGKWSTKNESFKSTFSVSSSQVRVDKDAASRARIGKDIQLARLKTEIADYRARIEEVNRLTSVDRNRVPQWIAAISEADSELAKLSKRMDILRGDERAALAEQQRLRKDWTGLYEQLDAITVDKLSYQAQLQSMRDEIKFLKTVQEQETRELQSLLVVAPADTKEFFRNEIALAVRDIRKEYQLLATVGKSKLESWYKSKVHSIQELSTRRGENSVVYNAQVKKMSSSMSELSTRYSQMEARNHSLEIEVKKLQKQVEEDHFSYEQAMAGYDSMLIRMREEAASLVAELQSLLDSKVTLDAEIAIYRALIEGEGQRMGVVVVQQVEEEHSDQWEVATKFHTVAHGHVAIVQTDPIGKFIVVANSSDYLEERIGGWRLKRVIDNGRELNYYFPGGYCIRPRQKVRIYASGQGAAGPDSLVFEAEQSWGMGANIVTSLFNALGEEKAVFTQKTGPVHK